jgi:hypothetical protein
MHYNIWLGLGRAFNVYFSFFAWPESVFFLGFGVETEKIAFLQICLD